MLRAHAVRFGAPPPHWAPVTTSIAAGARGEAPQQQRWPQPSTWTSPHHVSEHGRHLRSRPGPGAAHITPPAHVLTPQHAPKLTPPTRRAVVHPANSTARRTTALPSGGVSGGRWPAGPARGRAGAAEPAVQPAMCRARLVPVRRLWAPRRTLNGRARRPLNGPAVPPLGLGRRLRRARPHRPGSGEGRGGRDGWFRHIKWVCPSSA